MGKLALKNLLRNKRRTLLTASSLAMAVVLLCLLWSFLEAMARAEGADDSRVVVRSSVSLATALPESYWQRLRTLPHVEEVTVFNWYQGEYKDQRPENFFPRFSTDPETLFGVYPEYQIPEEQKAAWQAERGAFIAGKALADRYGWKLGDQIFIKGDIYPVDVNLTLRGIFTVPGVESQEKQIFFHRRYLEEALGNPGIVGTYFLKIDDPRAVPQVIKAAEAMFANSESQVRAETEKAFQLSFLELIGNIRLLFAAIGFAVIVSILFIVANTMAMAARERTGEVAVLKTLGFGSSQVMWLVLFESLAVGLLGAALGCALAALAIGGMASALDKIFPIFGSLFMTPKAWALGIAIGVVVGLVSGLFPALAASRLRIADALRRV